MEPLKVVNIGASPNDGTGDKSRVAFKKVNDNFATVEGALVDAVAAAAEAVEQAAQIVEDNRASIPEAQAAVEAEKFLTPAGGKALLQAQLSSTPVLPAGATTTVPVADLLPSDVRAFGAPVNTGTNEEDSLDARAGLLAAFASGQSIVLPEGEFYVTNDNLRTANRPKGSVISIRGAGSKKTTLRFETNFEDAQAIVFGNTEVVDLSKPIVVFPATNGSSTVNERPTTTIAVAAQIGDFEVTLTSVAGIEAGDIIRIKSRRLDRRAEHRNSIMCGETNEVVAVDVPNNKLLLRYPLADSYDPAIVVNAGAVSAATSTSVTVTGVDAGLADTVPGCRLEVMSGTGAGQVRYITDWNATTGVAKFTGEGPKNADGTGPAYGQLPFSVVPDATSVVQITRTPYVFHTKALDGLELAGLTIICNDKLPQGVSIRGVKDAHCNDLVIKKATESALTFSGCIRPRSKDITGEDCNDETAGYTIIVNACRDCEHLNTHARNNRRGGTDTAGTTPTWGGRIKGGSVVGGLRSTKVEMVDIDGELTRVVTYPLWSPVAGDDFNPNYGIGEHGQARDFVYSDFIIEGVLCGAVARGKNTKFVNITMVGPFWRHYYLSAGTNAKIIDPHYDGRADQSVTPQPDVPGDEGHFIVIGGTDFTGPLYVEGAALDGLQGSLIHCLVNTSLGVRDRVSAQVTMRDTRVKWHTSKAVGIFDGNDNYAINGWDIEAPVMTFGGTGSFELNRRLVAQASVAGQSVWFKYGNHYRISVAYQSTVSIPFPIGGTVAASANQLGVELFPALNNNQVRGSGYMRAGNTTVWAPHATNIGSTAIAVIGSVPNGTSGTVGQVTLHHTGGGSGRFVLENQMQVSAAGAELNAELRLSQVV